MTFGTVELNTRRRRKADPESDEAGHGRGRRWEGVYSNHQEQYIYIYIQCIVIHIVYDIYIHMICLGSPFIYSGRFFFLIILIKTKKMII